MSQSLGRRSQVLLHEQELEVWRRSDRLFAYLMIVQFLAGIGVALVMSPRTFDGAATRIHPHVWAALLLGAIVSAPGVFLGFRRPGELTTRHIIAIGQMLTSALLIHVSGGRIETHFHVFGSLAFLAFYRDWRVLLTATVVVAADHFVRGIWFPVSVYGIAYASKWRWIEHAFWVVFEDFILVFWCLGGRKEMKAIATKQSQLEKSQLEAAARQRLEKEMEIASRIQTGVLPRRLEVKGLELAARMEPATEVGGDYYDVLPVDGGAWIGIGDVSGHGLTSGLIMLMIQSALAGLGRQSPNAAPRDLLRLLNSFLFENVRKRLADDNHATLSLVRYFRDGRIVFAGAHEEIIVCKPDGRCERLETPGPWVGASRNIDRAAVDTTYQLGTDDVMVLYTDGITEAKNGDGEQFGMDRLTNAIIEVRARPVDEICEHVIAKLSAWTSLRQDDVTLVVVRHVGEEEARAAA